jgi:hypothetical protein
VPAIRGAAAARGPLTETERAVFAARDLARGRPSVEPLEGIVRGISPGGALVVEVASGMVEVRAGSLVLKEER